MSILSIILSLTISTVSMAGAGNGHGHGHSHGGAHSHGPGHSHGDQKKVLKVGPEVAEKLARNKIRVLAFQDKIHESWNTSKISTAVIKGFNGKMEWALTFTNENGVKGKTLYVYLKEDGTFIAANFTGK
jgi:hypothetical protein